MSLCARRKKRRCAVKPPHVYVCALFKEIGHTRMAAPVCCGMQHASPIPVLLSSVCPDVNLSCMDSTCAISCVPGVSPICHLDHQQAAFAVRGGFLPSQHGGEASCLHHLAKNESRWTLEVQ